MTRRHLHLTYMLAQGVTAAGFSAWLAPAGSRTLVAIVMFYVVFHLAGIEDNGDHTGNPEQP